MSKFSSTEMEYAEGAEPSSLKQSRIVGKVLSPAVRLWLRSQVEKVEDLQLRIEGGDRQILTGYIPKVSLSASRAVYQGLHFQQISLIAQNIRVNLGQVLKGKPLRLLEPISAKGELLLQEADLNASLQSPLLLSGLSEFLTLLLGGLDRAAVSLSDRQILWQDITIEPSEIRLRGILVDQSDRNSSSTITIRTGVQLVSRHELRLDNPQIEENSGANNFSLESLNLDLGPDVDIQELTLSSGQLVCRGSILVRE